MAESPTIGMRGEPALRPELRQSLRAGLRQGMALLALPAQDLHPELERLAADNPFLVVERPPPPASAPSGSTFGPASAALQAEAPVSLADHLRAQLACMDLSPRLRALAALLASDLDERGFLPAPDDEIARMIGVSTDEAAQARAALHACEPTGVGARDIPECIALQLAEQGIDPERARAATALLKPIAEQDFGPVARALGLGRREVLDLVERIRACSPDPASQFGAAEARLLIPEIAIDTGPSGELQVRLIDDPASAVTLDRSLLARARAAATQGKDAEGFVRSGQMAAHRLIASLAFRARTLLRVGEAVAEAQSAYLLGHARMPVPLSRAEIAARLGLHAATVGRAVKGRGVLFAGRVRQMDWFFPPGLPGRETEHSQPEIMARIRDMIDAETAGGVLSDDALAARLQDDGVDIARRTVAKYRQCLNIPSSSHRRRRLARMGGENR